MTNNNTEFTFTKIILSLKTKLLSARKKNEKEGLDDLFTIFITLREASYEVENKQLIEVLTLLADATRDAIMGVPWKSDFPSDEMISSSLSKEQN